MNDHTPGPRRDPGTWSTTAAALVMGCALATSAAAQEPSSAAATGPGGGAEKAPATAEAKREPVVSGRVLGREQPVSAAQVYAYDLATYALEKVMTDHKGRFLFEALPAGLYKIVAHKQGFVPAVEMLMHKRADVRHFLDLRLSEPDQDEMPLEGGYWQTRAHIPADVLQEIQRLGLEQARVESGLHIAGVKAFEAHMAAIGGTAQLGGGHGSAQLTDTRVGVEGTLGRTYVGLDGSYRELVPAEETEQASSGEARSVSLSLERSGQGRLDVASSSSEMREMRGDNAVGVDLRHFLVSWSGQAAGGESGFAARFVDERNYFNSGVFLDLDMPDASRTLNLEGSYSRDLTASTTLVSGLYFQQREGESLLGPEISDEIIGLFGVAGTQIQPQILVEYGLYSTMRDGELSLMPHGGVVVKLGDSWQAKTSFAQRVEDGQEGLPAGQGLPEEHGHGLPASFEPFTAASFDDGRTCRQIGESCYEVTFERGDQGATESLSVGAIHREFAETLRLYFSDDFFNRLESLLVVPGDEIPELQFRMVRQVSPKVLAKLESNFASGGGGIFYATDDQAYKNRVTYLVTSLDTRFQRTSTGVFLAFHHLEQAFDSLTQETSETESGNGHEIQRLQLMLTQDLSILAGIAPSLAVRFNMELSRGATPYSLTDNDELRKKVTGGISVSF